MVLPYLKELYNNRKELNFILVNITNEEERLRDLKGKCDTNLEKDALDAIYKAGIRLPDEAQKTIYDNDVPVVKPDFFHNETGSKGLCVFVDGPDHEKESVKKRR